MLSFVILNIVMLNGVAPVERLLTNLGPVKFTNYCLLILVF
jgi:hypothetical protein